MIARALTLAGFALIACGPKVDVENPSVFEEDDPRAGSPSEVREKPLLQSSEVREAPPSEISRVDFNRVLAQGPGNYMRQISIDPVMGEGDGSLRGWKITRWPYRFIDLRPGDVVLDVNGILVVRPDDVERLWQVLRDAPALVVRIERNGTEATLHLDILESTSDADPSPDA